MRDKDYPPEQLASTMRATYFDPFGTEHDPRYLLLLGAKEIDRLRTEILGLKDEVRHHESASKYWEARVIALEERQSLCGK